MIVKLTDVDWIKIGEDEPFYGVLTNPSFLKENLSAENLYEFWQSGVGDVDFFLSVLRKHFGDFYPKSAIDFGCGVGRLTRAIAEHVDKVTGVDVAPGMLAQAQLYAPDNATFSHDIPEEPVDWLVSHIVFQHMPPALGYELFETLLSRLAPGGCFNLHFTLFKNKDVIKDTMSLVDYASWDGQNLVAYAQNQAPIGAMQMNDYDLSRLVSIAVRVCGIGAFHMVHTDHGGCHGVILFGRRPN